MSIGAREGVLHDLWSYVRGNKCASIFMFSRGAALASFMVVDVLYYSAMGYSLVFVGTLVGAFTLAAAISELPLAILFDRYAGKKVLYAGMILRMIALAILFLNPGEAWLVAANILAGVGAAAASGTSEALIINNSGSESYADYSQLFAMFSLISAASNVVGGVIGAAVFSVFPRGIWAVAVLFLAVATVSLAWLRDSGEHVEPIPAKQYAAALTRIFTLRAYWVGFASGVASVVPYLLWQLKFSETSTAFVVLGFIAMNLIGVWGAFLSKHFPVTRSRFILAAALNLSTAWAFAVAPAGWLSMAFFVAHVIFKLVLGIMNGAYLHANIPNKVRAASGSLSALVGAISMSVFLPWAAALIQDSGAAVAILVSVAAYVAMALIAAFRPIRDPQRAASGV
ncbi:MFS transporter [Falsarthrobacter nasiphocae]|uniref:MFS family permease n=1 Tax=Falsarthrobacter nasiphocae TaxID=189863 RepID=A0AAE3YHH0_9MICC|nr:MFS transporter [Falsarthrobacter nasiphocae]MDR6891856.1 MFS family permease [Falsarthrobacter nasiphocae]